MKALVLPTTDGAIHFMLPDSPPEVPKHFKFDFEIKVRAVKIGDLRLFGRAETPTWCLIVLTYDDCAFVFHDFVFEVNTQHLSFQRSMQALGMKKRVKNPVLIRMLDHFKSLKS
jgi:hypothetical protein